VYSPALFGAGEYTLHHWKLESTSRGLLVIALLLVPLNLLVLADPSLGHAGASLEWSIKTVALLLALGMVRLAGRDLIGVSVLPGPIDRRWLFMLAIVGSAGSQLLFPRLLEEDSPPLFVVLGCIPVACHLLACGAVVAGLARARARSENKLLDVRQANSLFVFLGLSSFALFVALGFLLSRSAETVSMLSRLAEPFALASVPILAGGLLVWRGLPRDEAGLRTAGAGVAFGGLTFMLSAVVLAWPQPLPLLLVCLSNAILLSILAFRWRLPYAHAVALPSLALAALLVVQITLGNVTLTPEEATGWRLAEQLTSPSSGIVLAILMILSAATADTLIRFGQRGHAASYAIGSMALSVCSLLTTACHGVESPWPAVIVHGVSGACALALHRRWQRPALPYVGLSLFVVTSLWSLWALAPDNLALWGFVLALESAALALAAIGPHHLRRACRDLAAVAAALALGLALFTSGFPDQEWHTGTAALLALTSLVLAHLVRRPELTWIGSSFLFAAIAHLLIWDLGDAAPRHPLLLTLLAHSTLAWFGALLLQNPRRRSESVMPGPLLQSAVVTSLLALPHLLIPDVAALVLAGYTLWLAVLWLAFAVEWRSQAWFSAFQLAISVAAVFAVSAWLPDWDWFDPYRLQAYGIGLGLLGLGWIAARMALSDNVRVRELWEAPWPSVDRLMLGFLVIGQFALAVWGISAGVSDELIPTGYFSLLEWPSFVSHAYMPNAWALLGVLALVLLAALREKGRSSIVVGLLVLAVTVPILAAGPFGASLATASALRWGLALCYLVCSALVWLRRHLTRLATAAGVTLTTDGTTLLGSHAILSSVAIAVFLLTMQVALLGFSGLRPSGPMLPSIFAEMGWTLSHVCPLLVLTVGLVGHAVRERSPGFAFVGGLLANVSLTGGYALHVVTSGRHFDAEDLIHVGQLFSLAAGLWALGWLAISRWVQAWSEVPAMDGSAPPALATPLMRVQLGLALSVQLGLLLIGIVSLGDLQRVVEPSLTLPARSVVGSPLGWGALLASLAALFFRFVRRHCLLPWGWLFTGGLAVVSLLACTMDRLAPETGFYYLLLAWPLYVLFWSLLAVAFSQRIGATDRGWFDFTGMKEAVPLLLLPCVAAVLWALNTAASRQEYLWAAAAVSLCSIATAILAAWRRSEEQALLAGLGANLAASLLVWRLYHPLPPLWVVVIQANVLSSSLVTLIWLGVRRWLGERSPKLLLSAQALLGLVVHTVLLLLPLARLYVDPGTPLDPLFIQFGSAVGWAALILSATAAYWLLTLHWPQVRLHILGIAGMSAGVLAACAVSPWDPGNWRSFHVLQGCWCILGLSAALAGSVSHTNRAAIRLLALLPEKPLHRWLDGIGLAILALTLPGCWHDPLRPILPAAAFFTVSVLAAMLVIWTRLPLYVWISGLLADLIGVLFWWTWGADTAVSFMLTNALGLAVAAAAWIGLALSQKWNERPTIALQPHSSFVLFASNAALGLVVMLVLMLLGSDLQPPRITVSAIFAWVTLAVVAAALLAVWWETRTTFAALGLYVLGLAAVGLSLHELTHTPSGLGWSAALALAGYAVTASLFGSQARKPGLPSWFLPAQGVVAVVVLALSLWMCLDFAARMDRLAGPGAVLLLIPAVLPLIRRESGDEANRQAIMLALRSLVLILGAIAAAEIAWACPDPAGSTPWLHRNVLLMVALAGMTALYGVALPRWLAGRDEWVRCGRRFGPILGILASLTLLVLLMQEFRLYDAATRRTPMLWPEILVIIAALILLMMSGIRFAVVPGRDPLGLSERGRTLYVYSVELLLVLLFLHVRLNVPELFRGWGAKYWTLIVMLIAFVGVGLSEFFERRKLRVLAEPLQHTGVFLPLLPLLAFWAKPPVPLLNYADSHAPGLRPMLGYLEKLPQHFDSYAFLWLLVAGLYGLIFWTRRSTVFALLAAVAGNFALWSLFAHSGIAFLLHPQCWLIPPALIVLAAEHANRERLRPEASAGLRYLSITMIYVSSTADLFIAGLGNSVTLPIVLAVLSLAGVLLGILFRVRAFLFLGISFLFLDVFTMIWYAAVDRYQTWVWWVSGIVLGAAILTLFAVFEKRRNDVLRMLEEIKSWD
jgi:hypothetical protein